MQSPPVWMPVLLLVTFAPPAHPSAAALTPTGPGSPQTEVAAADTHAPPPRVLWLLKQAHRPRHWLYVTTTTDRIRLRADRIGDDGLEALHAFRSPPPPSPMGWDRIVSIERRQSRYRSGALLGAIVGSVTLGYAGGSLAEANGLYNDAGAWTGIAAGAVLGAWAGAHVGDRLERVTPLYVEPALASRSDAPGVTRALPLATVDVRRVGRATRPGDVLRVRGTFGEVVGHVASMDDDGLHGIKPDPRFDALEPPPDPIPWSSVWGMQRRGTAARRGAAIGALLLGVSSGAIAGAVSAGGIGLSNSGGSTEDVVGAFFGVGTIGALVGGGIGALIGHMFPVWHSVPGVSLD